ncbi:hypothetical protein [Mesorhizobium sp. M1399]|uniref:hypothetical protein n=1 Tax=Mesorhizobium sp. M1399 TaxID=2957096 RepID=UPI003335C6A4
MLDAGKIGHAFEDPPAIGREHRGRETQVELMNLVLRHRCRDPVDIGLDGHVLSPRRLHGVTCRRRVLADRYLVPGAEFERCSINVSEN